MTGPHCGHPECGLGPCDITGYAEHPCRNDGCTICGAPPNISPEMWAWHRARYRLMTPDERSRVDKYWAAHPLMRRATDTSPTIPADRLTAADPNGERR